MHARLVRASRRPASRSGRDRVTRLIIGLAVVLVVAGVPSDTAGEPTDKSPIDPVSVCIADCAAAYPDLGDDYDACVAACNEE